MQSLHAMPLLDVKRLSDNPDIFEDTSLQIGVCLGFTGLALLSDTDVYPAAAQSVVNNLRNPANWIPFSKPWREHRAKIGRVLTVMRNLLQEVHDRYTHLCQGLLYIKSWKRWYEYSVHKRPC